MPDRRQLSFASLDEVMPEVERLLAGHATVGQWSLGQICNHLASAIQLMIDGAPGATSVSVSEDPRYALIRQRFFRSGKFPDGQTPPFSEMVPGADLDDRAQAEALRHGLVRFQSAAGPFHRHPVLGAMTRDDWVRFHCLHAAHHLGFAVPFRSE